MVAACCLFVCCFLPPPHCHNQHKHYTLQHYSITRRLDVPTELLVHREHVDGVREDGGELVVEHDLAPVGRVLWGFLVGFF